MEYIVFRSTYVFESIIIFHILFLLLECSLEGLHLVKVEFFSLLTSREDYDESTTQFRVVKKKNIAIETTD